MRVTRTRRDAQADGLERWLPSSEMPLVRPPSPSARKTYYESLRGHAFALQVKRMHEEFEATSSELSAALHKPTPLATSAATTTADSGGARERPAREARRPFANWRWRRNALHASWQAREIAWLSWNRVRRSADRLLLAVAVGALKMNMTWRALKYERRRTGAAAAHTAASLALTHAARHRRRRALAVAAVSGRWHLSFWAHVAQRRFISSKCFRRWRRQMKATRSCGALRRRRALLLLQCAISLWNVAVDLWAAERGQAKILSDLAASQSELSVHQKAAWQQGEEQKRLFTDHIDKLQAELRLRHADMDEIEARNSTLELEMQKWNGRILGGSTGGGSLAANRVKKALTSPRLRRKVDNAELEVLAAQQAGSAEQRADTCQELLHRYLAKSLAHEGEVKALQHQVTRLLDKEKELYRALEMSLSSPRARVSAEGAYGRHLLAHRGEPHSKKKSGGGGGGGGGGGVDESQMSAVSSGTRHEFSGIDVFFKGEGSSSAAPTPRVGTLSHQPSLSSTGLPSVVSNRGGQGHVGMDAGGGGGSGAAGNKADDDGTGDGRADRGRGNGGARKVARLKEKKQKTPRSAVRGVGWSGVGTGGGGGGGSGGRPWVVGRILPLSTGVEDNVEGRDKGLRVRKKKKTKEIGWAVREVSAAGDRDADAAPNTLVEEESEGEESWSEDPEGELRCGGSHVEAAAPEGEGLGGEWGGGAGGRRRSGPPAGPLSAAGTVYQPVPPPIPFERSKSAGGSGQNGARARLLVDRDHGVKCNPEP